MVRRVAISVAGVALLCAASAYADEAGCISARYMAAGKYASCEAKAAAKGFADSAFVKCREKYADAWTKLGAKYPGTSCEGPRFVDNGDETITDNLTQLVWEKKVPGLNSGQDNLNPHDVDNLYSWTAGSTNADGAAFTDFVDDLNSAGFAASHDWRLPTLFELQTLLPVGICESSPCIVDPLFSVTKTSIYWSVSSAQGTPTKAWAVPTGFAVTDDVSKTDALYVRAVRGGF